MYVKRFINVSLLIAVVAIWSACGGSSSTSSSGGDDSDDTTSDTLVVEDLSTLPNLDLDSADVTSANFAAPLKSVADGESTEGGTSTSGCYAINLMKPTAMAQLKQGEMFKCYIEKTQDNASELVIPTDSYGHYIIDQGANAQGPRYIAARVGNFTLDSTTTLRMEACNGNDDGSSYSKMMEMAVSGNTSTKTWSGHTTSHMTLETPVETPEGGSVTGAFNNTTFTIVMASADVMEQDFDFANVTSLDTVSIFGRNPDPSDSDATDATTYDDGFQVTFGYDLASDIIDGVLNTVIGTFSNGSTVTGIIKARFNATIGAAQMSYTNTEMQGGDFNSSEAFSISGTGDSVTTTVVDETGATYSTLYDYVAAEEIASEAVTVPDDVTDAVAWQLDWDCTAPSGTTPTPITISSQDIYAECDALQEEIGSEMESGGGANCFEGGPGGEEGGQQDLSGTYDLDGTCLNMNPTATLSTTDEVTYTSSDISSGDVNAILTFSYQDGMCSNPQIAIPEIIVINTCTVTQNGNIEFTGVQSGPCDMTFIVPVQ